MADLSFAALLAIEPIQDQQATISGAEYIVSDADHGQTRWIRQASPMALRWPLTTRDRAVGAFMRRGTGEVTYDEDRADDADLDAPSGTSAIEADGLLTWVSHNPTGTDAVITLLGMLKPAAS